MRWIWSTFLLLTIVEKLYAAESNNCDDNTYKHDPSISSLNGYFWILFTTENQALDNEIINFNMTGNDAVCARTTNDGECCRTLNITVGQDHNSYDIESDEDCQTKVSDSGQIKLLSANADDDGSVCVILWGCRKSRQNVNANCNTRQLSLKQKLWIYGQYLWRGLHIHEVKQTVDYKGGKCFKN